MDNFYKKKILTMLKSQNTFKDSPSLSLLKKAGKNTHLLHRTFTEAHALSTSGEVYGVDRSIPRCPLLNDESVDNDKADEIKAKIRQSLCISSQEIPDGFSFLSCYPRVKITTPS